MVNTVSAHRQIPILPPDLMQDLAYACFHWEQDTSNQTKKGDIRAITVFASMVWGWGPWLHERLAQQPTIPAQSIRRGDEIFAQVVEKVKEIDFELGAMLVRCEEENLVLGISEA